MAKLNQDHPHRIARKARQMPGPPGLFEAGPCEGAHRRRGLTLLELLLALALSVLILAAVGMAIDLQLRTLETRRTYLEEAQLARAILRMIADDLRNAVLHQPQDFSAVEEMLASAAGGAIEEALSGGLGGDLDGAGGDLGGAGGVLGGAGGDLGGGGRDLGGAGGDLGGLGDDLGGAGGDLGGDDPLLDDLESPSGGIASSVEPPPIPGLYGNPFELQIDVSRLPRIGEYRYQSGSAFGAMGSLGSQLPSDIRTVAWYVQGGDQMSANQPGAMAAPLPASNSLVLGEFGQANSGLVRRELGRSVTQWAIDSGATQQLERVGELLAPEVTSIMFQYFDGYQWYSEWDSNSLGGLPLAVEVILYMQPRDSLDESGMPMLDPTLTEETSRGVVQGQLVYRLVVRLPTARPASTTGSSELEALGL